MIVTIDMETYYTKDYSLTKMSEVEYMLDPRFEVIMCAIKFGSQPAVVHTGHADVAAALDQIDWSSTACLSHNIRFDGSILAWHFGHTPKLYLDTLSMCRATTHWHLGKSSLKAVSDCLELPPKGDVVIRAQGKSLIDFTAEELLDYRQYCAVDCENCWEIFGRLRPAFTARELQVIDLVARMFIEPQVVLDRGVLEEHLEEVRAEKAAVLRVVEGLDKEVFSSNVKFAKLLEEHGVDVPVKKSPSTGEYIPAIARGDWAFKELCADSEQPPIVQALLATRLSVKSTIDETRAESLLRLSELRLWASVPLKYSGARTHRLSGDGGVNFQNFRRGSTLRRAIRAPDGYRIVHRDSSQIEARMTSWMAGCETLIEAFREGRDVYSEFASTIYDRPVTKADTLERFVGKTGILGLGYSCGAAKFRHMLFANSTGISHRIDLEEAQFIVESYRARYPEIPSLWRACDIMLDYMIEVPLRLRWLPEPIIDRLPVRIEIGALGLPSGLYLNYPRLRHHNSESDRIEACYDAPIAGVRKLYGGKLVENISQALSRIILTDIAVRVFQSTGYWPWLSTHDSLDYCLPEAEALSMNSLLEHEFSLAPEWAVGLPLSSEGGYGLTLLAAERQENQ